MKAISDRSRPFVLCQAVLLSCFLIAAPSYGQSATADSATSTETWSCLPEETAFAVRIPNGKAFAQQFVENTKLGSVLFSEKRKKLITDAIDKSDSNDWNEFKTKLEEYGLETDDLLQLFAGESGYAMVLVDDDQGRAVPLGLAWMEPGEELAERALEAIAQAIDEEDDAKQRPIRVDIELAGVEVMQLALPSVKTEYDEEFEYPENYEDLPQDEKETAWEQAYEKWENSAREVVYYSTALFAAHHGRILIGHSFDQSENEDSHPDSERLAGLFSRLLEAHDENGRGGFVEKYSDSEQATRVMSITGVGCFEMVGDVRQLMRLLEQSAPSEERLAQLKAVSGYESLGLFALKSALDGNLWETQMTLGIAEPREGLMQLFEQEAVDLDPPAWVPASAVSYSQISLDLGAAYALVKEVVSEEIPETTRYFELLEMQLFGFAQAGIEDVLSSVGSLHTMASFATQIDEVEEGMPQRPETVAIVWELANEEVWKNIFKTASPWVKNMPGGEVSDEQGYNGFRFSNNDSDASIFLGNGRLVLVVGPGMVETILSALNDPPAGSNSYRETEIYQRGAAMLPETTGIAFSITNGNEQAALVRDWALAMIENLENLREAMYAADEPEEDEQLWTLRLMKKLMPDDDEIENILGISAASYDVDDAGLQLFSIQELPPPE